MNSLYFDNYMILRALRKAKKLGALNNSITDGAGNTAGYLGEESLSNYIGSEIISNNEGKSKYSHDLLFNGIHIEVKTKRRIVKPRIDYDVSVAETSIHQKPDIYAFVSIECLSLEKDEYGKRVYTGIKDIWLCGFISYDDFFNKSKYLKKGQIDFSNNFTVKANCFNLPIGSLNSTLV